MERRFSWDHEETIIEFVKNHSVLFDINHPEYRNSAHKQRLWRELATILNRSTEDVQKKWFNIRDYHKRKKKGPPGPSGGKPSQREEALSFLDGFFCVKKRLNRESNPKVSARSVTGAPNRDNHLKNLK
ncbi:uncharacterized protein LOC111057858 [Nilaparvata lugens]|uniref:uncharacterized protein LOC111057858 n=1 Tax=Nilaparvata lugens TaxID=108931 RepID=UPI00193E23ED|nr:uncharacterized protein LOC111057858 [Nilaparvata lugens]